MTKRILLPLMAVALLLFVVGCSDNPSQPDATDEPNLSDEFGGYTTADEQPGFGDPELIASTEDEVEVADVMGSSPDVQAMEDDPDAGWFHFRAIWGQLRYDSSHTTPTDWTGSLTASRGALVIRRLVRFELNQDGYFPRSQRELVEWFSTTTTHNDGIVVDFFVPPVDPEVDTSYVVDTLGDTTDIVFDTLPVEPVTLAFETGPYTQTFTLAELARLDTVVTLDDGNAVAFQSMQMIPTCGRGHLRGHWGYDEEGNGIFRGVWHSRLGIAGYVQGRFGVDENDHKVFYGKWINRTGQFEGLIKGTYDSNVSDNASEVAQRRASGVLRGDIYDADGLRIGALKGHYKASPNFPSGWFNARWKLDCANATMDVNRIYQDGM